MVTGIIEFVDMAVGIRFALLDVVPIEGMMACSSIIGVPAEW